jgi:hypothetical protein
MSGSLIKTSRSSMNAHMERSRLKRQKHRTRRSPQQSAPGKAAA